MLKPDPTRRFKKDFKKYEHNKQVKKELETVLGILLKKEKLPEKYLDHALYYSQKIMSYFSSVKALAIQRSSLG